MSTTPEDRLRLEYRALKKRWDYRDSSIMGIIYFMARKHKRPCKEIRQIVGRRESGPPA